MEKQPRWQRHLKLENTDLRVLAEDWQILFSCQYPDVPFRWTQIVQKDGNVSAVKIVPIVIPENVVLTQGASILEAIREASPSRCETILIHEKRPYPALVRDAVGCTLCEFPGGVVDEHDVSVSGAAMREFQEELLGRGGRIVADSPLLETPAPAASGSHLEGYSVWAVLYQGSTDFTLSRTEPIVHYELMPLQEAYHVLKRRHESRKQCVEFKTLAALLMLERAYLDAYGEPLYRSP